MFQATRKYLNERRGGFLKIGGFVGGGYLAARYISERLEDVKNRVMQDRVARDNLRRRFQQTQEDVSFTVMAHIPNLSKQILEDMDVERLTNELRTRSKTAKDISDSISSPLLPPSESSIASSVDWVKEQDTHSEAAESSVAASSFAGIEHEDAKSLDGSMAMPVPQSTADGSTSSNWVEHLAAPSATGSSSPKSRTGTSESQIDGASDILSGAQLSDSIISGSSAPSLPGSSISVNDGHLHEGSADSSQISSRSKSELWNEVKILAFTRTLTILYTTTLFSLFTDVQLTILARHKYVQSILTSEREERARERIAASLQLSALLTGMGPSLEDDDDIYALRMDEEDVDESVEVMYLTLSWWLLNVGCKDIGERVRRGVEEVFEGVSLKSMLSAMDLHRLIGDVRRRVECEVTFEKTQRRTSFASALLPSTPETLSHMLTSGGLPPHLSSQPPYAFNLMLEETHEVINGPDFARAFEGALEMAASVLTRGVESCVFNLGAGGLDQAFGGPSLLEEERVRLAGMLPGLAKWSRIALESLPNELVDSLTATREMVALSAILFSRFEDRFR